VAAAFISPKRISAQDDTNEGPVELSADYNKELSIFHPALSGVV